MYDLQLGLDTVRRDKKFPNTNKSHIGLKTFELITFTIVLYKLISLQ